jgi:hypothetical protein
VSRPAAIQKALVDAAGAVGALAREVQLLVDERTIVARALMEKLNTLADRWDSVTDGYSAYDNCADELRALIAHATQPAGSSDVGEGS